MLTLPPRVAIIGSGAIGLYYGCRLALAGTEVRFLMRRDYAAVRTKNRIALRLGPQSFELRPAQVFRDPADMGVADLVVVGIKTTQNAALRELLRPVVGPNTFVVTLQNGLGSDELIGELVGRDKVLGGLAFIASNRTGPGEVACFHPGWLLVGALEGPPNSAARSLCDLSSAAGVVTKIADNLAEARWRKLVWNGPFNGLAVKYNVTTDIICGTPELAAKAMAVMRDVQASAASFGFHIPDAFLHEQMTVTPNMGAYPPSSLVDFRAGRAVEVEAI